MDKNKNPMSSLKPIAINMEHSLLSREAASSKTWIHAVCSYFRDFLDTDFKKGNAPKRAIRSRDGKGALTGIPLSRYPELYRDVWRILNKPLGRDLSLKITVPRQKYKSRPSANLINVTKSHISTISINALKSLGDATKVEARDCRQQFLTEPEKYSDEILNHIKTSLKSTVITPLVNRLDKFFENDRSNDDDKNDNLEEELEEILTQQISEPMLSAITSAIADNNFDEIDKLIRDAYDPGPIKQKFLDYFEIYQTSDFFKELTELQSTLKFNDNFQIYIYACATKSGKNSYPLFYFPVEMKLSDSIFTITADPHIFINKKAIDFTSGEITKDAGHHVSCTLPERILYLSEGEDFLTQIQSTLEILSTDLSFSESIDLRVFEGQKIHRSPIEINNSLHFAAFDKSDESILNDYEELLNILDSESDTAKDFHSLIGNFISSEESESFDRSVDNEWQESSLSERLVYESPVPLNAEQRKIISGLKYKDCRFVAVEGPPGTGKSHTITACVFDAIIKNKNVLILSDKKEALDVVEKKIRDTLKKVKLNPELQDPILRLGKHTKILSPGVIAKLKMNLPGLKKESALNGEIGHKTESIKSTIREIEAKAKGIDIQKIAAIQRNEKQLKSFFKNAENAFCDPSFVQGICVAKCISDFVGRNNVKNIFDCCEQVVTLENLDVLLSLQHKINANKESITITESMRFFRNFSTENLTLLGQLISEYQACRYPLVGFLFTKGKAREIDRKLGSEFECVSAHNAHIHLEKLERAEDEFRAAISDLNLTGIKKSMDMNLALFQYLQNIEIAPEDIESMQSAIKNYRSSIEQNATEQDATDYLKELGIDGSNIEMFVSRPPDLTNLEKLAAHAKDVNEVFDAFKNIPDMDYTEALTQLELLQTQQLVNILDGRVVEFATEKKKAADDIKTIIRKKQKFDKNLFEHLKEAFPVIIAGIRDYAKYMPLEKGIFDLVIIDEASQVSIAQALPAFVRAKKVLVLGDSNQFSNVKTSNASKAMNKDYTNKVLEQFKKEENPNQTMINKIELFDIKTSVLEFVERIANLQIMLLKHFRSYPDLISYSSKFFYAGTLESIKIRGKEIDEVIEFKRVNDENLIELTRNINQPEAEAVIVELEQLSQLDNPPDVCVITPHTEQQRYIYHEVQKRDNSADLIEKLKLRVFTFDTCQGEEADTILYSMVANQNRDRLNYLFAKDMKNFENSLRFQRLNVGFSRAKERVCFFHSKPIEKFSGSIGTALSHFKDTLEKAKKFPSPEDTDQKSPMEKKVLQWLQEVILVNELEIEIIPQFEMGKFLQQLDPTYTHPKYRVDFLLKVRNGNEVSLIVIEYDGFKEHFENLDEVNALNFEEFMKPSDIERQNTIKRYGYEFLRINRFNVGAKPVETLKERLEEIVGNITAIPETPKLIKEHHEQVQSLASGERKKCSRCKEIKNIENFYDENLKSNYGRVCLDCKNSHKSKTEKGADGIIKSSDYDFWLEED